MINQIWGSLVAADWSDISVAAGTVMLAIVTALLAWYTKKLADVTTQPSVIATLEPSRWSSIYFDLHVENEGTAAAYNVRTNFTPSIQLDQVKVDQPPPLQEISVLRSRQRMTSFVTSYKALEGQNFRVEVSWTRKPKSEKREGVTYDFNMKSFDGISTLGKDPSIQVAEELKKLRELYQAETRSNQRIGVDVYDARDRRREARERARMRARRRP